MIRPTMRQMLEFDDIAERAQFDDEWPDDMQDGRPPEGVSCMRTYIGEVSLWGVVNPTTLCLRFWREAV